MPEEHPEASGLPLDGIKVLEIASWIAAPACGRILKEWGAEVVKVEPVNGDALRGMGNPARIPDLSPPFELTNPGKKSVALNLKAPEALPLLRRLVVASDVVLTNVRPAGRAALGLDYSEVAEFAPDVVFCVVSGYGYEGPAANRPGFDGAAYWAASGWVWPSAAVWTNRWRHGLPLATTQPPCPPLRESVQLSTPAAGRGVASWCTRHSSETAPINWGGTTQTSPGWDRRLRRRPGGVRRIHSTTPTSARGTSGLYSSTCSPMWPGGRSARPWGWSTCSTTPSTRPPAVEPATGRNWWRYLMRRLPPGTARTLERRWSSGRHLGSPSNARRGHRG